MFWNKKSALTIVGGSWAAYSYVYGDDNLAVISFDTAAALEKEHIGYEYCVRIVIRIPFENAYENGMPESSVLPAIQKIEEDIIQVLQKERVDCRFVGRMTYGAMRELVFQCQNAVLFKKSTAAVMSVSVFELDLLERDGWKFFDEKIRPSAVHWQQIDDSTTIRLLVEAGSDPKKVHLLDHTFIGDQERLRQLSSKLRAVGFTELEALGNRLVLQRASTLDLDEVFGVTSKLLRECSEAGVKFDGWGAAVISK